MPRQGWIKVNFRHSSTSRAILRTGLSTQVVPGGQPVSRGRHFGDPCRWQYVVLAHIGETHIFCEWSLTHNVVVFVSLTQSFDNLRQTNVILALGIPLGGDRNGPIHTARSRRRNVRRRFTFGQSWESGGVSFGHQPITLGGHYVCFAGGRLARKPHGQSHESVRSVGKLSFITGRKKKILINKKYFLIHGCWWQPCPAVP